MQNPYQSNAASSGERPAAIDGDVDDESLDALEGTRGWVRFLALLGFIGSALMALGGLGMIAAGALGFGDETEGGSAVFIGMGVGYFLAVALWVYPLLALYRYAKGIDAVLVSRRLRDLAQALDHQRRFFRFVGVLMVVTVAIYAFAIVAAVAIPAFLSI